MGCHALTATDPDHPRGGPICVARLTFANAGLAPGQSTAFRTLHSLRGTSLGISSDYISDTGACGGAVPFPNEWTVDDVVGVSGGT